MQDDAWQAFSERVSCEDSWHVDSEPLAWPLPDAMAQAMAERNMATLATIAALSERHADLAEDDSPVMQELQRMDAKLSALIDLVNHLLVPLSNLPSRQSLRFNAIGAVLPAALVPADDASLLLRLRFDECRSLPLELAARVDRQLDDGRIFVVFVRQSEAQGDAIERLVFRYHRRKVAESRQLTI
ncbi:MAG: PilZ domain-containing protein [Rhodanobacter sp.]